MTEDIKGDIDKQDQGKDDFPTNSDEIACITPQENHTSEELEDIYLFL